MVFTSKSKPQEKEPFYQDQVKSESVAQPSERVFHGIKVEQKLEMEERDVYNSSSQHKHNRSISQKKIRKVAPTKSKPRKKMGQKKVVNDKKDDRQGLDNDDDEAFAPHRGRKQFKRSQNLKNISAYIKLLITSNKNLNVKTLSYLLYEIIGQTPLGQEIADSVSPTITQQTFKELHRKYSDDRHGTQQGKTVRNVRRRLYDALNVMISANVIEKSANTLRIVHQNNSVKVQHEVKIEVKIEEQIFQEQAEKEVIKQEKHKGYKLNRQSTIAEKKKALQEQQQFYNSMKGLITRNSKKKQSLGQKIFFPVSLVRQRVKNHLNYEGLGSVLKAKGVHLQDIYGSKEALELLSTHEKTARNKLL